MAHEIIKPYGEIRNQLYNFHPYIKENMAKELAEFAQLDEKIKDGFTLNKNDITKILGTGISTQKMSRINVFEMKNRYFPTDYFTKSDSISFAIKTYFDTNDKEYEILNTDLGSIIFIKTSDKVNLILEHESLSKPIFLCIFNTEDYDKKGLEFELSFTKYNVNSLKFKSNLKNTIDIDVNRQILVDTLTDMFNTKGFMILNECIPIMFYYAKFKTDSGVINFFPYQFNQDYSIEDLTNDYTILVNSEK